MDLQTCPFNFREVRWQMCNRLGYDRGDRGVITALEWSGDYRDFLGGAFEWREGTVYAFDYRPEQLFSPTLIVELRKKLGELIMVLNCIKYKHNV